MRRVFLLAAFFGLSLPVFAQPLITDLALVPIATGFEHPVYATHAQDARLFVVEQAGRVLIVKDGKRLPVPFLDIRHRVGSGGELGLLSIAFHPDFARNGRFFVDYTAEYNGQLRTVIAEYRVFAKNPNQAAPEERALLTIVQPYGNHKGGQLQFGPDGYLYIGMGDGGGAGDPLRQGQSLQTLLGKILRIDVNSDSAYAIPQDNPFTESAFPEIWAYGLRNPWRFSFEKGSGRLFAADVGQDTYEEVDVVERGGNYGWNIMEGKHCFPPPSTVCPTRGLTPPVAEYDHTEGISITGGYAYWGNRIPWLQGTYVFGDYGSAVIWGLRESDEGRWTRQVLLKSPEAISSFGEDSDGELYVVGYQGTLFKIVPSFAKKANSN